MRAWTNGGAPYDHDAAAARAREHAGEFVAKVIARADEYRAARARPALVVCALDTELLGHWWYEGPVWLEHVLEHAAEQGLALTTLPAALERHEPVGRPLGESSWAIEKNLRTWDSPRVADFVWTARQAELDLSGAFTRTSFEKLKSCMAPARRAARELLALQSSDWSFMTTRGLAAEYAHERMRGHSAGFREAIAAVEHGMTDFRAMPDEHVRGLAPHLDLAPLLESPSGWGRSRD